MTGTEWTAPGEGSTLQEVANALHWPIWWARIAKCSHYLQANILRTNLRLTGSPITEEDWTRLESDDFRVGE